MSLRHGFFMACGGKKYQLPELNGTVVWWGTAKKQLKIVGSSDGLRVQAVKPSAGTFSGELGTALYDDMGVYTKNAIGQMPAITNVTNYGLGTVSDFAFLYDKSRPYGIFTIGSAESSGALYNSFFGGANSGIYVAFTPDGAVAKAIRNADGSTSVDLFNVSGTPGTYSFGTNVLVSDIFYGYQVSGNDQAITLNNDAPALVIAECASSSFNPTASENELTFGGLVDDNYTLAEFLIMDFSGLTRAEIDEDKATIQTFFNNSYSLW